MGWADHVTHMGEIIIHIQYWSENKKRRDHLEELGIDWRIILGWILGTRVRRCGLDSSG